MKKLGNLQRRWQEQQPAVYDRDTRIVRMDIVKETGSVEVDGEQQERDGYSFVQVQIDTQMDYGHIKSQLIEAGYSQKDEFGLVMNGLDVFIHAVADSATYDEMKTSVAAHTDIAAFEDFCTFRKMCADAAKTVMAYYE